MIGTLSKIFGGNKSEKDVKKILPIVNKINQFFTAYANLSNDELRNKTVEFKQRISGHLNEINQQIVEKNTLFTCLYPSFIIPTGMSANYNCSFP